MRQPGPTKFNKSFAITSAAECFSAIRNMIHPKPRKIGETTLTNDFREAQTIYVDAKNGKTTFTMELPEDGDLTAITDAPKIELRELVPSTDLEEQDVSDEKRDRLSKV